MPKPPANHIYSPISPPNKNIASRSLTSSQSGQIDTIAFSENRNRTWAGIPSSVSDAERVKALALVWGGVGSSSPCYLLLPSASFLRLFPELLLCGLFSGFSRTHALVGGLKQHFLYSFVCNAALRILAGGGGECGNGCFAFVLFCLLVWLWLWAFLKDDSAIPFCNRGVSYLRLVWTGFCPLLHRSCYDRYTASRFLTLSERLMRHYSRDEPGFCRSMQPRSVRKMSKTAVAKSER